MTGDLPTTLTVAHAAVDAGRSLREAFYMFWETLWALVLGFGLSGAVQAFVSRSEMRSRLGDHRPVAIVRATLYGSISSSCSYAASAMARSMFAGGADFVASMVFMFASTNLVVELGVVLAVLIGWQFVAAEFVGGAIMIVLLVMAGGLWFRGRALDEARRATAERSDGTGEGTAVSRLAWSKRIRSKGGWADAASYTMSDLRMLRREMVIGFVVAGFLAVLVPLRVWNDLFIRGHGPATTLENVAVGPLVAVISFVCSIGNVPLAAALWKGGISFGGVVSFIFADLITFPLLLVYRRQYGRRMGLRMLGVFWLVMSLAGLITEGIFDVVGAIPKTRPAVIAGDGFGWNYTTVLDIAALGVFAGLYWLAHHRQRFGGGAGYATDPVCGMQVEIIHAPSSAEHHGRPVYFCSEHCADRFGKHLDRHLDGAGRDATATDPVCGMTVDPDSAAAHRERDGTSYWFCSSGCAVAFDANPTEAVGSR